MEHAPRYWLGLLIFCVAAVFTVVLGSVMQYRAIAVQQAAIAALGGEPLTASLLPPTAHTRKASYY
jgi:drug/metabolite transporter (DMT)-like permease